MRRLTCLLAMVLGGCVVSVQPIVPRASATFDARLIGHWGEVEGKDRIVLTRGEGNTYDIEYRESDGKVGRFEGHLGRLGARTVFDVQPAQREKSPMPEAASLIRGHMLYVLTVGTDTVRMALMDPKPLREALAGKKVALVGFNDKDQVVLTGTTDELRRLLPAWMDRPGALGDPSTWIRVR